MAGRQFLDRRQFGLADRADLARAAGLERAAGRRIHGEGRSPSSTMCFFLTDVSAIGTADSSASV